MSNQVIFPAAVINAERTLERLNAVMSSLVKVEPKFAVECFTASLPVAFVSHIAIMPPHAIIQAIPESKTLATCWTSEKFVSSVFSVVCVQIRFGLVNFATLVTCVLSCIVRVVNLLNMVPHRGPLQVFPTNRAGISANAVMFNVVFRERVKIQKFFVALITFEFSVCLVLPPLPFSVFCL